MARGRIMLREVLSSEVPKKAAFIVNVVRLWSIPKFGRSQGVLAIHMVLQDEEGVRVEATIDQTLLQKFEDKIVEHGFYAMKNFDIVKNTEKYRPAVHQFKFQFQRNTQVYPVDRSAYSQGPLVLYNTLSIDEICRIPPVNLDNLIDFIGAYYPKDGLKNGTNTKGTATYQSFFLTDLSKKRIYCSLWENYGVEAKAKLENCSADMVVILLQLCRVSQNASFTLSTSFHVSKIIIDEDIPEIEEFRRAFNSVNQNRSLSQSYHSGTSTTSTVILPHPMCKISKLLDIKQVAGYHFYGKIVKVFDPWYGNTCPKSGCDNELIHSEYGYTCCGCQENFVDPLQKYKIRCEVNDCDSTTFVELSDEDCRRLIGKSVTKVLAALDKHEAEPVPKDIARMVGQDFLFKVAKCSEGAGSVKTFKIESVCNDPAILTLYKEGCQELSDEMLDSDDDLSLMFSNRTEVDSNLSAQDTEDSTVTPSSKPAKRTNSDGDEGALATQSSSNKKLKELMKDVKIEMS